MRNWRDIGGVSSKKIEVSRIFVSRSSGVLIPLPFCYCKKQIDVSFSCVCPVIDHEFLHNIVKVAVDPRGDSRVDPQTDINLLIWNLLS